jgi:hypothetical protein
LEGLVPGARGQGAADASGEIPGPWPLLGRSKELGLLDAAFDDPDCRGLVLVGDAGVGKTRLLDAALDRARDRAWDTERLVATAASRTIPLGAFATATLPRVSSEDRLGLFVDVTQALQDRAVGRRLVVAVDDAHQLDDLSAALVQQVAATGAAFVVMTVRAGVPAPEPVTALWKDGLAARLDVPPLSAGAVETLVVAGLGGPCDPATVRELARVSGGNALFLRELVRGGIEARTIVRRDGWWQGKEQLALTESLVELVEARMGRLQPDERAALAVLAVGGVTEAAVLERLSDAAVLDELDRKGLIEPTRSGRRQQLSLAHPIFGEVALAATDAATGREMRLRLASAIQEVGARRRDDRLRVAAWNLEAGGAMDAATWLTAAAAARGRFDFGLAERLARAAVDARGGFAASYAVALSLVGQGRGGDAEAVLAPLEATASTDADRARLALLRVQNLQFLRGHADDVQGILTRALEHVSDRRWRGELEAAALGSPRSTRRDEVPAGVDGGDEGSTAPDRDLTRRTLMGQALGWGLQGHTNAALQAIDDWLATHDADDSEGTEGLATLRTVHWAVLCMAGRYDAAVEVARSLHEDAVASQASLRQGLAAFMVGDAALPQGRPRTAARWLDEAAVIMRGRPSHFFVECLGGLTLAHAMTGQLEAGAAALAEADALGDESPGAIYHVERGRRWLAAARGELAVARAMARDAVQASQALQGQPLYEAWTLHDLARLGAPDAAAPRLRTLARGVEGDLVPLYAAHVTALVGGDGAALDAAAAAFEALGARLWAAEAARAAAGAHRAAGAVDAAGASEVVAARLVADCEGARSPGLAEPLYAPGPGPRPAAAPHR